MRHALFALILCAFAGTVAAQGLGEAARKESERRSRTKGGGKVYSADDLRGGAPETPADPEAAPPEPPSGSTGDGAASSSAGSDTRKGQTEAQWRNRAKGYRDEIARWEREIDEADREATTAAYDGPVDRDGNRNTAHPRAVGRAKTARRALANTREAYQNFEDEARRAGVPPGWLR